tara:strand:+ start:318 stop:599 length:282 start_codon:yes stop_codon:yes gene_type:complete
MTILGIPDGELPKALLIGKIVKDITVKYRLLSQTPVHSRENEADRQNRTLSKILFDTLEALNEHTLTQIHEAIQASRDNQEGSDTHEPPLESR